MWSIIDILVLFEHISQYLQTVWESIKESARMYLGPSPHSKYLLFDSNEVIPEGREHCKYSHVAYYIPHEHRVVALESTNPYKRLPWISVQYCIGDHTVDLSDWMSDIRANTSIPLIALLRLASHALNIHLPETDHAKVLVITRDGEEEEYTYSSKTSLLKYSVSVLEQSQAQSQAQSQPTELQDMEIHRRVTCPYDVDSPLCF